MAAEFTHLHLHTDYSLLDGACDVDKLAGHLSKIGQTAAAMTDHGNIFGAVHFFDAMQKKGLKPLFSADAFTEYVLTRLRKCLSMNYLRRPNPKAMSLYILNS